MNDGGPAFPVQDCTKTAQLPGMSLRDWFAGMALQGMAASSEGWLGDTDAVEVARRSYCVADAMLKAREQQ